MTRPTVGTSEVVDSSSIFFGCSFLGFGNEIGRKSTTVSALVISWVAFAIVGLVSSLKR